MTLVAIKQKLHRYLDVADDKKVEAIFALVENDIYANEYSAALKLELDSRLKSYQDGEKMILANESKSRINAILSKK